MYKIYNKLNYGNALAHDINLNNSIIEKIFQKIKSKTDENYFDDLISDLKTTKAEKILKALIFMLKKIIIQRIY